MKYDYKKLAEAIKRTHEIDESGDADFTKWLMEQDTENDAFWDRPFGALMTDFLIWANGPNWESFLATAKVGDVPPGTSQ